MKASSCISASSRMGTSGSCGSSWATTAGVAAGTTTSTTGGGGGGGGGLADADVADSAGSWARRASRCSVSWASRWFGEEMNFFFNNETGNSRRPCWHHKIERHAHGVLPLVTGYVIPFQKPMRCRYLKSFHFCETTSLKFQIFSRFLFK